MIGSIPRVAFLPPPLRVPHLPQKSITREAVVKVFDVFAGWAGSKCVFSNHTFVRWGLKMKEYWQRAQHKVCCANSFKGCFSFWRGIGAVSTFSNVICYRLVSNLTIGWGVFLFHSIVCLVTTRTSFKSLLESLFQSCQVCSCLRLLPPRKPQSVRLECSNQKKNPTVLLLFSRLLRYPSWLSRRSFQTEMVSDKLGASNPSLDGFIRSVFERALTSTQNQLDLASTWRFELLSYHLSYHLVGWLE